MVFYFGTQMPDNAPDGAILDDGTGFATGRDGGLSCKYYLKLSTANHLDRLNLRCSFFHVKLSYCFAHLSSQTDGTATVTRMSIGLVAGAA